MARQRELDTQVGATKGFVTEFTPTAFPREAAVDVDNCVMDSDGGVRRRPGVDLEQRWVANSVDGGVISAPELETLGFSTSLWEAVSNSGSLNIVVQQAGLHLLFFAQFGAVSANFLGSLDLTPFAINPVELAKNAVQTASGLGDLYVVNPYMEPTRVTYDGSSFVGEKLTLKIRDTDGLDDGLEIDERPDVLTIEHFYNLLNQGWSTENINKFMSLSLGGSGLAGIAEAILKASGELAGLFPAPSNADIMHTGITTNSDGDLEFNSTYIKENYFGNTPAPKGHYILEAFNKDYSGVSGIDGLPSVVFDTRPAAVAFHQGRAFFPTPSAQGAIGGILYSQQLTSKDKVSNCFQEADPTASEVNDLVATDGGFLPTPGVGQIFTMRELGNGVAVLASNGVWYITGADIGSAMSATNIRLEKVSETGALGAASVVEADGSIFYWGIDGIIQLSPTEVDIQAVNISQRSIQTFYVNINAEARAQAAGIYIPEQRKIYWGYREALATVTPTKRSFNKFLVLDFDLGGFYKYSIANDATQNFPEILGMTLVKPLSEGVSTNDVLELNGTQVTELDGSPVTESVVETSGQLTQLKLATMVYTTVESGYKVTFSTFHSRSFTDWRDFDINGVGIPMTSYVEFAHFNMQAVHTKGTPTYVHSYYRKTSKNLEPGGYYELPPLYYPSTGMRVSQSVIEVLNKPSSNMRASQSVLEVLMVAPSDFRVSQSVLETISAV